MNILSLFDGMSCGQIALRELGIKVDKYFASETQIFKMLGNGWTVEVIKHIFKYINQ